MRKIILLILIFTLSSCGLITEENVEKQNFIEVLNNTLPYYYEFAEYYDDWNVYDEGKSYNYYSGYFFTRIYPDQLSQMDQIHNLVFAHGSGRIASKIPCVVYEFTTTTSDLGRYVCYEVKISSAKVKVGGYDFSKYYENKTNIDRYITKHFDFYYSESLSTSEKTVYKLGTKTYAYYLNFYDGYWTVNGNISLVEE